MSVGCNRGEDFTRTPGRRIGSGGVSRLSAPAGVATGSARGRSGGCRIADINIENITTTATDATAREALRTFMFDSSGRSRASRAPRDVA
jgi:hypothetical protein